MGMIDDLIANAKQRPAKAAKRRNKYDIDLQVLLINDEWHLENHLNYLFRTDKGQKWTNELTPGNAYIIKEPCGDGFEWVATDTLDERQELKRLVQSRIRWRAEDRGVSVKEYVPALSQTRVDYRDSGVYSFTDEVQADTEELLQDVTENTEGFDLICLVVHVDQKENFVHTHMLFCMG